MINMGCVPVLVDADLATLNMSVEAAQAAISPKTRAILVADILGNCADLARLQELAATHGLLLLEDTCESLGTTFHGQYAGTFGLAGTYSFYFSHHIPTVEGGMVVTYDDEFADLCRCLRSHGWTREMERRSALEAEHPDLDPRFLFVNVGYNLRPTELQAAFGLHQLPKLERFNRRRKEIGALFRKALAPYADYIQVFEPTAGTDHTGLGFPVLLAPEITHLLKDFVTHLEAHRIQTRPIVAGNLAVQPALKHFPHRISGALPNADQIMKRGVYWGVHPHFSDAQVFHLVDTLKSFF